MEKTNYIQERKEMIQQAIEKLDSWSSNNLYDGDKLWYTRDGITTIIETSGAYKTPFEINKRLEWFEQSGNIRDLEYQSLSNSKINLDIIFNKWDAISKKYIQEDKININNIYDTIISLPNGELKDSTVKEFNYICVELNKSYVKWGMLKNDLLYPGFLAEFKFDRYFPNNPDVI